MLKLPPARGPPTHHCTWHVTSMACVLLCRAAATDTPKVIVCYYPQWSHWTRGIGRFLPSDISPGLCSHINFAFTKINTNYQVCQRPAVSSHCPESYLHNRIDLKLLLTLIECQ